MSYLLFPAIIVFWAYITYRYLSKRRIEHAAKVLVSNQNNIATKDQILFFIKCEDYDGRGRAYKAELARIRDIISPFPLKVGHLIWASKKIDGEISGEEIPYFHNTAKPKHRKFWNCFF